MDDGQHSPNIKLQEQMWFTELGSTGMALTCLPRHQAPPALRHSAVYFMANGTLTVPPVLERSLLLTVAATECLASVK